MIRDEFEKTLKEKMWVNVDDKRNPEYEVALWAAKWMAERCANVANRYMADQTDPAKSVAASDIKFMIRQLAKELSCENYQ